MITLSQKSKAEVENGYFITPFYVSFTQSHVQVIKSPKKYSVIFVCVRMCVYVGGMPITFTTLQLSSLKLLDEEEEDRTQGTLET